MKVYFLVRRSDGYYSMDFSNNSALLNELGSSVGVFRQGPNWRSVSFKWDRRGRPAPRKGKPDLILDALGFCVSESCLKRVFPKCSENIELLPIDVEGEPWFFVNCLKATKDYDESRSSLFRNLPPRSLVVDIDRLVITDPAMADVDMFTLENSARRIRLVTETFKQRIEQAGIGYAVDFRDVGWIDTSGCAVAMTPRSQSPESGMDAIHAYHAGLPAPTSLAPDREVEPIMPTDEALDLLLAQQRPAFQLVPAASAGWSQVGGRPTLPDDMAWPMGCEGPMAFLAQLDLTEIPAAPVVLPGLPTTGCLYFFYDPDLPPDALDRGEGPGWQVIHLTQRPVAPPRDTPDALPDDLRFAAAAVGFRAIRTVPSFERIGVDWSRLADDNFDRFDELRDGAYGEHAFHQIGGYPANIQDDTMEEECQRVAESLLQRSGLDPAGWRLLLQVGSDEALGMMWGDGGNIYFWIHEDDLAQGDFSRVWAVLQSF